MHSPAWIFLLLWESVQRTAVIKKCKQNNWTLVWWKMIIIAWSYFCTWPNDLWHPAMAYRMGEHGEHGVHGIHQLQDLRHSFTIQDILFVIQSALFVKQINQNISIYDNPLRKWSGVSSRWEKCGALSSAGVSVYQQSIIHQVITDRPRDIWYTVSMHFLVVRYFDWT